MVAVFKKHLYSATRGDTLHVDTFNTIVVEIENVINRRPLTAISDDPSDAKQLLLHIFCIQRPLLILRRPSSPMTVATATRARHGSARKAVLTHFGKAGQRSI